MTYRRGAESYRRKAEYYRQRAARRLGRRLFAAGLLLLGVVLPFAVALLAPARPSGAAMLPTAHVRVPTPQPAAVALAQSGASDQSMVSTPPAIEAATPAPAVPAVDVAPAAPAPALPAEPTLTSTPIQLAPVDGSAAPPLATLFPTVPANVPAAPADAPSAPQPSGLPPPILMYHYIRNVDQGSDPMGYDLSVTPDDFASQMAWLHEQGYIGVRMDGITRCLRGAASCPGKAIALTFDDGYEDAFTNALPVLKRYGLVATFYIITNFVGQPGYMTWEQVAALRDAGMEIGSHTVSHLDLTSLDSETANVEITQSKAELDKHLNINVTSFCYPTGLYNAGIEEQARAAGYLNAVTTRWDNDTSDILGLPRRRISGGTALDGFMWIVQS